MNTSHFSQNPDSHEPGSPQNPVQETAVEAAPAAAVPQAIVPESAAPEATNLEPVAPEAVVPASVAPQLPVTPQAAPTAGARPAIEIRGLTKAFGQKVAVDRINLDIPSGSFYGLVGRNGAGKTTTISMVTGMLMPSEGTAYVRGIDMWTEPLKAKAHLGVLPDGVHLFDKLTGEQLITYSGYLHGIDKETVASRVKDLLTAMDLTDAAGRAVADYSAGMTKKIALAAALVHAPSVLILDEPFEAVDPVSAANIQDILRGFVASGGTVIISSHVMDLVQRLCDHVAVMDSGRILAAGTVDEVRAGMSLEERFVQLVGGRTSSEGLSWLGTSSH